MSDTVRLMKTPPLARAIDLLKALIPTCSCHDVYRNRKEIDPHCTRHARCKDALDFVEKYEAAAQVTDCYPIDIAVGPHSPFEYDQGDTVRVEYDELYDLVQENIRLGRALTAHN